MKRLKLPTPTYAPPPSWFDPRAQPFAPVARFVATTPAARCASSDVDDAHSTRRACVRLERVRGRGARALAALAAQQLAARTGAAGAVALRAVGSARAAAAPRALAVVCAADVATEAATAVTAASVAPAAPVVADAALSRPAPDTSFRRRRTTDSEEDPSPAVFASESRLDVRGVLRESAPQGVAATQEQEPCSPQSQTL